MTPKHWGAADFLPSPCRHCGVDIMWASTVNGARVLIDYLPDASGRAVLIGKVAQGHGQAVTPLVSFGTGAVGEHHVVHGLHCPGYQP